MLKKIILVVLVIAIPLSFYLYKEYHRKPADLSSVQPAAKLNAGAFLDEYEKDEANANHRYLGKTIQVRGTITEIVKQQDTLANVMIGDTASMHKVSCLLDKHHIGLINQYKAGQQITIKGICTGFLMDVELNRCVIVEKE
ncbi:hypothetical protein QWZ08_03690 [Ferruginibacter paludis]|uniref:OB-fold protein n=1 Tax=Ferruginibacter TaxID=1004303 RepID=UPI0025B42F72|nr:MULTISPECIES: hypothetical protein [Ferruginibacter]MDB5280158.1 hypothetical protein [Ferruginibacter sp.]MDN3654715.1 hypothetical protein [Ferruginibacter paludis]